MGSKTTCLKCGAPLTGDARGDFCPKCLFPQASAGDSDELSQASQIAPSSTVATGLPLPRAFGDYELLEEIARGAMGIVFKARQRKLDRLVAVKLILAGEFASREQVLRFRAEVEAAARLQHPNIVRIHETGEQEGQPYFSMDYVEGGSLAALVREKPLPAKRAAGYVKTIAEAIHYAPTLAIHHLNTSERTALFFRILQQLQPGGWFVNIDIGLPDGTAFTEWQFDRWREWISDRERQQPRTDSLRDVPELARRDPDNKFSSLTSQLNSLRSVGFADVECLYRHSVFVLYCGRKPAMAQTASE